MSTKIYNAFKFNGSASELMEHCRSYREIWHEFHIKRIGGMILENESYLALSDKIKEQSKKPSPSFFDEYDVRGCIAVYFHKKNIYIQTFLQTFGQPPSFVDDRFVDFHYQNQSDPSYTYEDNFRNWSPAEKRKAARNWNIRKKVWDEIFSGNYSSASEAGLIYEFCCDFDFYKIAGKLAQIKVEDVEAMK